MKTKTIVKQNKKQNKKTQKNLGKRRQTRKNNLKRIKRKNRRTRRRGGMRWPFGRGATTPQSEKTADNVRSPLHKGNQSSQSPSPPVNKPPAVENPEDVKRKQLVQMNGNLNDYKRQTGELVNSTEDILRKQFNNVSGMSAENRLKHHRMKLYKNNSMNTLEEKRKAKAEEMKVLQGKTWGYRSQQARQSAMNNYRLKKGKGQGAAPSLSHKDIDNLLGDLPQEFRYKEPS